MITFGVRKGDCSVDDQRIIVEGNFRRFLKRTFYGRVVITGLLLFSLIVGLFLTMLTPVGLLFFLPVILAVAALYWFRARDFPFSDDRRVVIPVQAITDFEEHSSAPLTAGFFRIRYMKGDNEETIEIVPRAWEFDRARQAFVNREFI